MRFGTLALASLSLALFASDLLAQGGRGRNRRPEEITNRTGAFFTDTAGPATDGDKIADLGTTELVRAAVAAGQLTVLYLHDSKADADVRGEFERQLFAGDELGIELRCFHCGRIDVQKDPALAARYGKKAPLFVVFDAAGKATEVAMTGYKPSASQLTKVLEKAASGTIKPSLAAFAKQYGDLVRDLEQGLTKQKQANEKLAKAGEDKAKRAEAEKDLAALEAEQKKLLAKESELLGKVRLPERSAEAQRVGGWAGWGERRGERGGAGGGERGGTGGERRGG